MKNTRLIFVVILLSTSLIGKTQVFVDIKATGLKNGTTWQDAYTSLDTALLNTDYGEIWVSSGIYIPSIPVNGDNDNRNVSFFFKSNVSCYGGFNGTETSKHERNISNNMTILSGNIGEKGSYLDNAYHVIFNDYDDLDTNAVYDGFIITGAYLGNSWVNGSGGGIYLSHVGTPVIRNCIIMKNYSKHGGGIAIERCDPIIENNLIINNQAFEGAGILVSHHANPIIKKNKIIKNESKNYPSIGFSSLTGGGIQVNSYCSPLIYGNIIAGNYAGDKGGGIHLESNYGVNVFNNYIIDNISRDGGGVFVDGTRTSFINNLIVKNRAYDNGGGVYMDYTGRTRLINNTISFNYSSIGGGLYMSAANAEIINNILYYNIASYNIAFHNEASNSNQAFIYIGRTDWRPEFTFNQIEGGMDNIGIISDSYSNFSDSIFYEDNFVSEPMFLDALHNDFQTDILSDAIDGGIQDTTGLNILSYDFFENFRIFNNRIDIGAIEYNGFYHSMDKIYDINSINSIITNINSFIRFSETTSIDKFNNFIYDIYPNPFADFIVVETNKVLSFSIYNIFGTLLFSDYILNRQTINLSILKKGIYIIRFDNGISKKIFKIN